MFTDSDDAHSDPAAPATLLPAGMSLTVEAHSVRDAIAAVVEKLGPSAQILRAERVTTRPIGARSSCEMIRLTAQRPLEHSVDASTVPDELDLDAVTTRAETVEEFPAVLRRELAAKGLRLPTPDQRDEMIADALEGGRESTQLREVAMGVLGAAEVGEIDLRLAGPDWSLDRLWRLGLPFGVVEAVAAARPSDSPQWRAALSAAVSPYCAPADLHGHLLIGPGAVRLAARIGVRVIPLDELESVNDDVVAVDAALDQAQSTGRPLHAVLDGPSLPTVGDIERLAAVSIVEPSAVGVAIQLCYEHNARLAYVVTETGALAARSDRIAAIVEQLLT